MKYLLSILCSFVLVWGVFVLPQSVDAQSPVPGTPPANPSTVTGGTPVPGTSLSAPASNDSKQRLQNPLRFDSIGDLIDAILDIIAILAVPVIVFFIIYAGFLYVTARGNEQQVSKATQALTWAVVGGVIILGASVLIDIIQATVDAFKR